MTPQIPISRLEYESLAMLQKIDTFAFWFRWRLDLKRASKTQIIKNKLYPL